VSDFFSVEHPIRLAHRGSRILWPENTLYAFERAVEDYGYRYLELDVNLSADRVPMVIHDRSLGRTTNATGPVSALTFEELQQLDAGYRFDPQGDYPLRGAGLTIPTLDQVYKAFPEARINIDLKQPGEEWAVAEVIKDNRAEHRTLVGSFYDRRIARFRRITGGNVAVSAGPTTVARMFMQSRMGLAPRAPVQAYQLTDEYRGFTVDRRLVDAVHRAGAHLHVWTVNDADEMRRLLDLGVDGIITDRPDVLNDVLDG
jgi:glycerophosphoryl diester phosphodiesterase